MASKRVHFVDSQKPTRTANPLRGGRTRNNTKKTKTGRRKPEWDTTVNDLSVYKLSKLEVEKRHKSHQSKNAEVAKHDLYEKAKGTYDLDTSGNLRPSPLSASGRKPTALQKSLHGKELHDVLAESDRALRVVKDLFGDDPKRYSCQPNVTVAPHVINDKKMLERTLLENHRDGPAPTATASPGGIRDESVLEIAPRKPALNELPSPQSHNNSNDADISSFDEATPIPSHQPHQLTETTPTNTNGGYQSAIDLKRFQTLLDQQEKKTSNTSHAAPAHPMQRHQTDQHAPIHQQGHTASTTMSQGQQNSRKKLHVQMPVVAHELFENNRRVENFEGTVEDEQASLTGISELSSIPAVDDGNRVLFVDEEEEQPDGLDGGTDSRAGVVDTFVPTVTLKDKQNESSNNRKSTVKPTKQSSKQTLQGHPLQVVHKKPDQRMVNGQGADVENVPPPYSMGQESNDKVHNELQMLEKLVSELNQDLHEYEKSTSYPVPSDTNQDHSRLKVTTNRGTKTGGTLNGITVSLLSSVHKMTHYLKQSEIQLKGEIALRDQLLQTMTEQQNLMDTLTMDLVKVREENVALRNELTEIKLTTSEQIRKMQDELSEVHKQLSALAIQQAQVQSSSSLLHSNPAHQAPPPLPYSYLSPLVPILPPQIQSSKYPPPLFTVGVTPSSGQSVPQSKAHGEATVHVHESVPVQEVVHNPGGLGSPNSVHGTRKALLSDGVVYAQASPLVQGDSELVKGRQQHTLKSDFQSLYSTTHSLSTSEDTKQPPASLNTLDTPPTSNLYTSFTPLKTMSPSLDVSYAPSPPPLSVALQIPSLSMDTTTAMTDTSSLNGTPWLHNTGLRNETIPLKSAETNSQVVPTIHTTTNSMITGSSQTVSSSGMSNEAKDSTTAVSSTTFDVAVFLNSLGKLGSKPYQPSYSRASTEFSTSTDGISLVTNNENKSLKDELQGTQSTSNNDLPPNSLANHSPLDVHVGKLSPFKAHHTLSPLQQDSINTFSGSPGTHIDSQDSVTTASSSQSYGINAQPSRTQGLVTRSSSSEYSTVSLPVVGNVESIDIHEYSGTGEGVTGSRSASSLPVFSGSSSSRKTGWFALSTHLSSQ